MEAIERKTRLNFKVYESLNLIIALSLLLIILFSSCSKEIDLEDDKCEGLKGAVYTYKEEPGQFFDFINSIEDIGKPLIGAEITRSQGRSIVTFALPNQEPVPREKDVIIRTDYSGQFDFNNETCLIKYNYQADAKLLGYRYSSGLISKTNSFIAHRRVPIKFHFITSDNSFNPSLLKYKILRPDDNLPISQFRYDNSWFKDFRPGFLDNVKQGNCMENMNFVLKYSYNNGNWETIDFFTGEDGKTIEVILN